MNKLVVLLLVATMIASTEASSMSQRQLIINGHQAPRDRYPYFSTLDHNCGGALIAPDTIITAGHCLPWDMYGVQPHVGRYSFLHPISKAYDIVAMERHPRWKCLGEDEFRNDFSILFLNETIDDIPYIRINRHPDMPLPQQNLTAMGVGWTSSNWKHAKKAMVLQEVGLNYLPNEQCKLANNAKRLAESDDDDAEYITYEGRIHKDHLCTTGGPNNERDACAYDSGSPIIIPGESPEEDILVALVSFGIDCANPDFPAANSRISSAVDFITDAVCEYSMDPPPEFQCEGPTEEPTESPTEAPTESPTSQTIVPPLDDDTTTTTNTFEHHMHQPWEKFVAGLIVALFLYWLSKRISSSWKVASTVLPSREEKRKGEKEPLYQTSPASSTATSSTTSSHASYDAVEILTV